jgi:hypothetical protein
MIVALVTVEICRKLARTRIVSIEM